MEKNPQAIRVLGGGTRSTGWGEDIGRALHSGSEVARSSLRIQPESEH